MLSLSLFGACAAAAQGGTIHVSTTADQYGAQHGKCALREAIVAVNTDSDFGGCNDSADPDTVALGARRYVLTREGADEQAAQTGDLDITDDLRIRGEGAGVTVVDGNKEDRVFDTATPLALRISDLTVTRGKTPNFSGGGIATTSGPGAALTIERSVIRDNFGAGGAGGVVAAGTVTIKHSLVAGNRSGSGTAAGGISVQGGGTAEVVDTRVIGNKSAAFAGGLYANSADLVVRDSVIRGNKALAGDAGGVAQLAGSLEVSDSVIERNTATEGGGGVQGLATSITLEETTVRKNKALEGGGIFTESSSTQLELDRSTVSANRAIGDGGGLSVLNGTATLVNSTVSGNAARNNAGGIYVGGTANNADVGLNNVAVADNVADSDVAGGGSGGGVFRGDGLVFLRNSVLGDNSALGGGAAEPDCDGGIAVTYSLIEDDCPGLGSNNIVGVDPKLKPLAGNGGATRTHALKGSSPALEAADPATPGSSDEACRTTDQRGKPRPGGAVCDMGAYERQP